RQKQLPAKTALSTDTFRPSRSPARQRTPAALIGRLVIPIVIDHRLLPTCLTLLAPFLDALAEHIEVDTLHHPAQLRTGSKPHEDRTLHKAFQTMAVFSWRFVAVPGGGKVTAQTALDLSQIRFFMHVNCPRWSKYAYQTNIFSTHKIRNTTTRSEEHTSELQSPENL